MSQGKNKATFGPALWFRRKQAIVKFPQCRVYVYGPTHLWWWSVYIYAERHIHYDFDNAACSYFPHNVLHFIYIYDNDWNIKSLNVQSGGARILPCEWSVVTVVRAWLCETAGWLHALDVRSSWNMQQDMFNWTLVVMTVLPMKWRILPPGSNEWVWAWACQHTVAVQLAYS